MKVTLGAHNIKIQEESQQIIPVAKVNHHPEFNNETITNDIMLLKTTKIMFYSGRLGYCKISLVPNGFSLFTGGPGGPLPRKKAAVGIISYGDKNDSAPRVFTKVSSFLFWIKKMMKHS
ncbi:Cathepsin G [Lemmus lemmus]